MLALAWVAWLLGHAARALLREPLAKEVARATGRRRKELEREKQALLKALKELELDHEMGKVSDSDYRRDWRRLPRARGPCHAPARHQRPRGQLRRAGGARRQRTRRADRRAPEEHREEHGVWRLGAARPAAARLRRENDPTPSSVRSARPAGRGGGGGQSPRASAGAARRAAASAQPMMMDPSQMSGIPRPDPQVPAGTITVRLIRGELTNRIVGPSVSSSRVPTARRRHQKTDAEGRATFCRPHRGGPLSSPMRQGWRQRSRRSRLQLSARDGHRGSCWSSPLGGARRRRDGTRGHPDKSLPSGVLVVRAEDAAGHALEGLDVTLGTQRAVTEQGGERLLRGKTDVEGEASFEGLEKPTSGYLAEVSWRTAARFASKPFSSWRTSAPASPSRCARSRTDLPSLQIAEARTILFEVTDDAHPGERGLPPQQPRAAASRRRGPKGCSIPPAARRAASLLVADSPPAVTISGHDAVWRGPLPPATPSCVCASRSPITGRRGARSADADPVRTEAIVTQQSWAACP